MKRATTLPEGIAILVVLTILGALLIPCTGGMRNGRSHTCANNLRSLHQVLHVYLAECRGRFPEERGAAFWLALAETKPPLIDPSSQEIYFCVLKGEIGGPGETDYRGPADPPTNYTSEDPIGADKEGNHGEGRGGNVLLKNGSVQEVGPDDRLWVRCRTKLAP